MENDDPRARYPAAFVPPFTLSITAAAELYGIDRHTLGQAIARGEIKVKRLNTRKTLVPKLEMEMWIRGEKDAPETQELRREARRQVRRTRRSR